jgi:hypothetical protein
MSQPRTVPPRPLPRALIVVGSLAIGVHLLAIMMLVLAAQSGPWLTRFGDSPAEGPWFATRLTNYVVRDQQGTIISRSGLLPWYLEPLRMTDNYHFASNRPLVSEVFFEARLKDDKGSVTTLTFPDTGANAWLRHRETLLALGLGDDIAVQAPRGEVIPAPGQKMRTFMIWEPVKGEDALKLKEVPEHLVPKDRPVFRPSEWSLLLARAYARHLCREHGAASVELICHSKDQVMPAVLFLPEPPPDTFNELVCSFGEVRREE